MRRILLIFKNDMKRRLKSPTAVLVLLAIPMIMTGIMGAVFAPSGGEAGLPAIKVLLVDHDKNVASRILLGAFDADQMKDMFQVSLVEEEEGKKLMGKGKASAMVIIPEKFTEDIVDGKVTRFIVEKNPSEQFLPDIVEEFMNTAAILLSGVTQVFGEEIKMVKQLIDLPLENVTTTDMLPYLDMAKDKILLLKEYLSPLLLSLKEEVTGKKEKQPKINIFSYVLPGISIMFLLFIIEIFIRDILTDRETGMLRRMMFAPLKSMEYIVARITSGWIMGIMATFVIVAMGKLVFNIAWGNYLHLFLFTAVTCLWIAAFFSLLNSFFKNRNQAGALTAPIILAFSAFGGSMVQVSQMPKAFGTVAQFTLNHWFITGVNNIRTGIFPLVPMLVLLVSGVILFILAAIFLRKRLTTH